MNPTIAMSFKQLSAKVREVYLNARAEAEGRDAEVAALKSPVKTAKKPATGTSTAGSPPQDAAG